MKETRFKDTEIGRIPEDWNLALLGDITKFLSNNTFSRDKLHVDGGKGEIKNIHYGDVLVKYGSILDVSRTKIPTIDSGKIASFCPENLAQDGDVIIADTAEDDTVCKVTELWNIGDSKVVSGLHTMWCRPDCNTFAVKYLGYFMNSVFYHIQILPLIQGIKVSSVSKNSIKDTWVCIPPLSEQSRIASALTSIDNLISSLDKLIEKKKAIKEGTMQQLLTGKKRLKGFNEPWVEKSIDDLCNRFDNQRIPISERNRRKGNIPYYGANGIQDYVCGYTHDGDYILLAEDGANSLSNYPIRYVSGKIWVNNHAHVLQAKDFISDNKYLSYALKMIKYEEHIVGSGRAKLNSVTLMSLALLISPNIQEQKAIAQILSCLDNEITVLEAKRNKYIKAKQGMMQQLLTGKIRLV